MYPRSPTFFADEIPQPKGSCLSPAISPFALGVARFAASQSYLHKHLRLSEVFMRSLTVFSSILLFSALSFGQNGFGQNWRGIPGYYPYGCGPYIPMITTPSLTFETLFQNPAGATNATGGLTAGATDSTLSQVSGDTSAAYTMPVWYSGGQTPLISPLGNRTFAPGEGHKKAMWHASEEAGLRGTKEPAQAIPNENAEHQDWIYFSSAEPAGTEGVPTGQASKPLRSFSNDDALRQNLQNGSVKYDSKTEKIQ